MAEPSTPIDPVDLDEIIAHWERLTERADHVAEVVAVARGWSEHAAKYTTFQLVAFDLDGDVETNYVDYDRDSMSLYYPGDYLSLSDEEITEREKQAIEARRLRDEERKQREQREAAQREEADARATFKRLKARFEGD